MASTDTLRAPAPPQVKKKGQCRFCGEAVLTTGGKPAKGYQHDACRKRWERINRPSQVRDEVLARTDGRRCVDCRNVFPESQIEVDHVHGLSHGGDNDPSNYVPRCVRCHDKKTAKEKELRDRTPAKGGDNLVGDVTKVPPPVDGWLWARTVMVTWVIGSAVFFAAWSFLDRVPPAGPGEWWDDVQAAMPEALLLGVLPALVPAAVWRGLVWRRNRKVNAQIVWERLCRASGTPNARTRGKFRVHKWKGGMPAAVTIRVDRSFNPHDDDARQKLLEEFARVLEVDPSGVEATVGSKQGQVRLTVKEQLPPAPPPPAPVDDGRWAEKVAASLRPAIGDEDITVTVVETDDNDRPVVVHVAYPERAASRSAKAKVPVLDTLRDSYPRRGREWFIDHDAPEFRYVLTSRPDPLRKTIVPPPVTAPDLWAGIELGQTETGDPWRMPLAGNAAHLFCAGLSGAGKGSIEWATIRALAPAIRDGWVRLWIIDPKQGAELGALEPMCAGMAENDEEALPLLERLESVVAGKYQALKKSKRRFLDAFTRDEPFDLLLIDEAASLYDGPEKKRNDAMMAVTKRLVNISRAAGVAIHVYTQNPLVSSFPARDLFPRRLALRLGSADHVDRVLGGGAKDGGALAWRIPETQQGVGYLVVNGNTAAPLRVRAAYVTDTEIERIVAEFTPPRALPADPPAPVAAEQPELTPPAPDGDGWVSWDDLAEADLPVSGVRLDSNDPDPVVVEQITDTGGRWQVTFRYDGEHSPRIHDFDKGDCVMILT